MDTFNLDLQPILKNKLIFLRPLTTSDFTTLFAVASDPLIWEQHTAFDRYTESVFKRFFQEAIDSGGTLIAIELAKGTVIGSSRYERVPGVNTAIEIGWTFLSRAYWGGVYNGAMKKLMIDHAMKSIESVIFHIAKENLRSQKAVEKIGGRKISPEDYPELIKDSEAMFTYAITKDEWIKRPS